MPSDLKDHTDFFTARGARAIADRINEYWLEQGVGGIVAYPVQRPGSNDYDVRSNMVNGRAPVVKQKATLKIKIDDKAVAKMVSDAMQKHAAELGRGVRAR